MAPDMLMTDGPVRLGAGLLLGLVAGSFLATLVIRWPLGRTLGGRSACDGCGATLGPSALVPVLSFVAQHGRCRRCGGEIDRVHVRMELLGALIGGASMLQPGWIGVAGATMGWFLLALAMLDLRHLWLPDRLTIPFLALGPVASWATGTPGVAQSAIGAAAGWAVLAGIAALYRRLRGRIGIGGGDPKLFAGIGAWLGWQALPLVLLVAALLGLAAAFVLQRRGREVTRATAMPLGALLALAAWPIWLVGIER